MTKHIDTKPFIPNQLFLSIEKINDVITQFCKEHKYSYCKYSLRDVMADEANSNGLSISQVAKEGKISLATLLEREWKCLSTHINDNHIKKLKLMFQKEFNY